MEDQILELNPGFVILWFAAAFYFMYCFTQSVEEYERKRFEKIRDQQKKDEESQKSKDP